MYFLSVLFFWVDNIADNLAKKKKKLESTIYFIISVGYPIILVHVFININTLTRKILTQTKSQCNKQNIFFCIPKTQ